MAEGGFIIQAEVHGCDYIISIESLRGSLCDISLPGYFKQPYVYLIDGNKPVPADNGTEQNPHESLKLHIGEGQRFILISTEIGMIEYCEAEKVQKNNSVKRCGNAKLGEVHIF
jgi:hypothetical protein